MAFLDNLERKATLSPRHLLLPEGNDGRVLKAAERLAHRKIAVISVGGEPGEIRQAARSAGVSLSNLSLLDCGDSSLIQKTSESLRESRGDRLGKDRIEAYARDPLFQAATLVSRGDADGYVAGAAHSTADVLRSALWLLGTAPGVDTVSSYFAMVRQIGSTEELYFFADGGVVPDPSSSQLADIAIATSDNFALMTGKEPHVALLSFSTRGSADHPRVDRVRDAVAHVRARRPDIHVDGELQVDAAISPEVANIKAPDSLVAGHANVLIFPDLDSANIGYKLVQRLGGWQAIGPLLQGVAKPANDLSRGASPEDIFNVSLFALAQAASQKKRSAVTGGSAS